MDLQRYNANSRPVSWPKWSSAIWLAIPLGALYCVSDTWWPFVVIASVASLPAMLFIAILVVLAVVTVLEVLLGWLCAAPRNLSQPPARYQPQVVPVSFNRSWKCKSGPVLYSPEGQEMRHDNYIEKRAGLELALTEQEADGRVDTARPKLKRYIMHMATVCYGEGSERIAQIFSTCVDFTALGAERFRTLNWFRDCNRDDDMSALARSGAWPIPAECSVEDEGVWLERYKKCNRKSPHVKFYDVREYESGHRLVRHGKLSVNAAVNASRYNEKQRIV